MASALNGGIERILRAAVASGRFDEIGGLLAANATLDTSNENGRRRVQGRKAIVAHLSNPGPGELLHWDAHAWPSGLAVTFEWRGPSGVDAPPLVRAS